MHRPILRRAGIALTVVGLCDISIMIYCIINRISYSSSLNIFAVIAGIFLWRGSLRAAVIVRWIAALILGAFGALALAWPFIEPIDLLFVRFNLDPLGYLEAIALLLGILVFFYWINRELRRDALQIALMENGFKLRSQYIPAAVGTTFVAVVTIVALISLGGQRSQQAKSAAEERLGAGYRFNVKSLDITSTNSKTIITCVVVAWKKTEIQYITIRWEE